MSEYYVPGAAVYQEHSNRWSRELIGIRVGEVAKVYKNGNFTVRWNNSDKPDPQQYRAAKLQTDAWPTGAGTGRIDRLTPDKAQHVKDVAAYVRAKARIRQAQKRIAEFDPATYTPAQAFELEGIAGALENILPESKQ